MHFKLEKDADEKQPINQYPKITQHCLNPKTLEEVEDVSQNERNVESCLIEYEEEEKCF